MPLFGKKKDEKSSSQGKGYPTSGYPTHADHQGQYASPQPSAPPPYSAQPPSGHMSAYGGAPPQPPSGYVPAYGAPQPGNMPAYGAPPPGNMPAYGAPPQQPAYYPSQHTQYGVGPRAQYIPPPMVAAPGSFDAGARFDGRNPPSIPPPPPGCAPNAAQLASMQGQNVAISQKPSSFFSGGSDGGYTFW